MLSPRSDPPFYLPLRSAFCLHQYLLLIHALALQVVIVMDWEASLTILMVALLLRHYQVMITEAHGLRFDRLAHLPGTGWQLYLDDEELPVEVIATHRFGRRWWMLRLQSEAKSPITLILCPDTLDDIQAIVLKQRLLMHREPPAMNEIEQLRSKSNAKHIK